MLCLDGWRANVIHCLWELINRPQPKAAESYYATCGKIAEQNWDNQEAVMIENRVTCPSSQKICTLKDKGVTVHKIPCPELPAKFRCIKSFYFIF